MLIDQRLINLINKSSCEFFRCQATHHAFEDRLCNNSFYETFIIISCLIYMFLFSREAPNEISYLEIKIIRGM